METKYVRVPFDVELAKKITEKSVDGKIVTRDGRSVRIVCFDAHCEDSIVALVDDSLGLESTFNYLNNGKFCIGDEKECDLFLEIPEHMTFKDGDVLIDGADMPFIYNGHKDEQWGYGYICGLNYNGILSINKNMADSRWTYSIKRRATEEERQKLINALKESKEPKAKEYLKRFFGIEEKNEYEFKPFDKVLVRDADGVWFADIFSHYSNSSVFKYKTAGGASWEYCIPYNEETAHLLGTTEKYE